MNNMIERDNNLCETSADLIEVTQGILLDARTDLSKTNNISIPIAELATLGAAVSSLIPAFRTITQSTSMPTEGLYRLADSAAKGTLKAAKNGNLWGALKTADGTSKLAQFQEVGSVTGSSSTVMPISPVVILMAVALHSVEKQLGNIADMEKQILNFLENEKQSEIEADVEMLTSMITKYKTNWDNEHYIVSNHKLALDIQRTARKNMLSYQRTVADALQTKKLLVGQTKINTALNELIKKFKYYRLSLYSFALASLLEIMLSGNFKEDNIQNTINEIEQLSAEYRSQFEAGSAYIERMSKASIEANVLKGVGITANALGKAIGSIPKIRDGQADDYLQGKGTSIKKNVEESQKELLSTFSTVSNPNTRGLLNNLKDMAQIYNHTQAMYFDNNYVYLLSD